MRIELNGEKIKKINHCIESEVLTTKLNSHQPSAIGAQKIKTKHKL